MDKQELRIIQDVIVRFYAICGVSEYEPIGGVLPKYITSVSLKDNLYPEYYDVLKGIADRIRS